MSSHSGSYRLGPDNATLTVRTGTAGAMAKAGHSLEIRVSAWSTQLELGDDPAAISLSLEVDSRSLTVISGSGGPKPLTDEDKVKIARTVNDKIFKGGEISFRSTGAHEAASGGLHVHGELNLLGTTGPAEFTLKIAEDGHLTAVTEVTQTAFGIEPYSAMLGALKVKDEVVIDVEGRLPSE
jgi:polyisoprenoid-binding protein YceI